MTTNIYKNNYILTSIQILSTIYSMLFKGISNHLKEFKQRKFKKNLNKN